MMKVIKLGGRVQSDPELARVLAGLWKSKPGSLCIVHGGGDEISTLQRALGREPTFVNGRWITSAEDIDLVRMVLSGSANKRVVSALREAGVQAVGISGEDGAMLSAEPIDSEKFGRSGRPIAADVRVIKSLVESGFLPVISPVGFDASSSEALNVNGDDAAAVIAGALGAELWMIADVPGVMDANRQIIDELDQSKTESLVADGTVNSGMRAKLEAGFHALAAGASKVRIAGLNALRGVETGTLLSLTPSMT